MAVDDIDWWVALRSLLDDYEDSIVGERCAVYDFAALHKKLTMLEKEQP